MRKSVRLALTAVALASGLVATASAQSARSVSGTYNGMEWTAQSMLTGVTNTQVGGPVTNGGDPIYWPSFPRDSGVVHLLMDYGPQIGAFICSGSLLADGRILTAAHCVSDGAGTANPLTTTVYFQPVGGIAPGTRIQTNGLPNGGAESRTVASYDVHPLYTGQVIDHNDIALLTLTSAAPAHATGYQLYTAMDLEGQNFTVHGYGALGDGATGRNNFTARLRNGDNKYDFDLGNAAFGTNWGTVLGAPMSRIEHSIVSDFDNGLAANDTACLVAQASNIGGAAGAAFCNTGLGAREVGVAGGDSGGPSFINGMISSVNSYGLTFGLPWGDIGPAGCGGAPLPSCLNSSFGEFSGYVPVNIHAQWIATGVVPEPGTYALMGLGLAAVGAMVRRR
ncbi:MAG: trypsin-like serine protease, partial [Rubrivivax sp.]|nr:trypsin-like serine protease [Rubrivivax sp.]